MKIMNKALVICHGDMAFGLVSAINKILGDNGRLFALTNTDKSIPDLLTEVEEIISENDIEQPIFFADLRGGSCWRVAMQIIKKNKRGIVFSGVNLPMLVKFLTNYESLDTFDKLKENLVAETTKTIMGES